MVNDRDARVALLLSGGVDSSVALFRLKELGYREVTAYYIKIWLEDELAYLGQCPWEEDLAFARSVTEAARVPLEIVSLQSEYYERVVRYVLEELEVGNTPSPDIFCNQRIKFGAFLDAVGPRCDKVATGHYAILEEAGGSWILKRGVDRVKDQTYFLSHLSQDQLARAIFPLGTFEKTRVRKIARELGLPNADRRDSQGICFLGRLKYDDFVKHYLGERPGPIIERETGRVLGEHRGFWFHTIGQRQGLRLGAGPWYVSGKDPSRNIVYVTFRERLPEASRREFRVGRLHWIGDPPTRSELGVKVRHGPTVQRCSIEPAEPGVLRVRLEKPDPGIAPGQFAVFYDGEICLGGGKILEG